MKIEIRARIPRASLTKFFVTRRTHSQVGSTVLNLSSLTRHALKQWLSNAYGITASGRSLVLRPPLPSLKNSAPPRAGRGVAGLPSLSESFRLGKGLLRDSPHLEKVIFELSHLKHDLVHRVFHHLL